jgi:hypothetical protein
MGKIFVVLEQCFEYNDEGYDCTEGGNTIKGFTTREAAENFAKKKSVQALRKSSEIIAGQYLEDVFFLRGIEILRECNVIGPGETYLDHENIELLEGCTDEVLEALSEQLKECYRLFYVEELEVEE